MINLWTKNSGSSLGIIPERITASIPLPVNNTYVFSSIDLISGSLPPGLRIEQNLIVGTPFEVNASRVFTFVVRATSGNFFQDRTFSLTVEGADEPIWLTNEGLLDIGPNNSLFILDTSPVDYQLIATDTDLPAGDQLEFFIKPGNGELPPGLQLTIDGRLIGVVDPLLSLDFDSGSGHYDSNKYAGYPYDFGVLPSNGFASYFYDAFTFDYSVATLAPRKLNRYYEFIVSVTDSISIVDRRFKIYVVGDDFLRVDNTDMQGSTVLFTADNTYLRTPIWLTPANLGFRRANNYITLFLDVLDSPNLLGGLQYNVEDFNPDGSRSELPPGMQIDQNTGEVAGRVPYQPAVTKEYKFTVTATRFSGELDRLGINGTFFEDTLMGVNQFKIFKLEQNQGGIFDGDDDGIDDLRELIGRSIAINDFSYKVISVSDTNPNFDTITLDRTLNPQVSLVVNKTASPGDSFFDVSRLTQAQRQRVVGRKLNFLSNESYTIEKLIPYVEWEIKSRSGSEIEIDFQAAGIDQPTPGESFEDQIKRCLNDAETFVDLSNPSKIRIQTPASTRSSRSRMELIFVSADSTQNDIVVTEIQNNFDRVFLDAPLQRTLISGNNIGIALFARDGFEKVVTIISTDETVTPARSKTFSVNILGEVDSVITWLTPEYLGSISANFTSTFSVRAETTVPNAKLIYTLVSGRLPPGLSLIFDGEIVGKIRQFGDNENDGLTIFNSGTTLFDAGDTTIDRQFQFTVDARDRFGYSAIQRTFTIDVLDPNDLLYSNLYLKPLLKEQQRTEFRQLTSDPSIFPPQLVYRPNDPEFGLQNEIKMLAYAGIETKNIADYVAASAKHHKKTRYQMGDVKTAVAKEPGTNNVVYEVVYVEVVDPSQPQDSKTRKSFNIKSGNTITADSIQYSVKDDQFKTNTGIPEVSIGTVTFIDDTYFVVTRQNETFNILASEADVLTQVGEEISFATETDSEPFKFRPTPEPNTIKADSNAVKVSSSKDTTRYISNIVNMRDEIRTIGVTEREFLPLWMRTPQAGNVSEPDFILAIPLCYCRPGTSDQVLLNLKNRAFDFKQLDLTVDRYVIDSTTGKSEEQYILFANYQYNV